MDDNKDGVSQTSEDGIPLLNVAVRLSDGSLDAKLLGHIIGEWAGLLETPACLAALARSGVTSSKVFTVADIVANSTYREREDILSVTDRDLGTLRMQAVVPRLANFPGGVWRSGPTLGEDNDEVFRGALGLDAGEVAALRANGVI